MVAEGLPHEYIPGKPGQLIFLSAIERQAYEFGANNVAIESLQHAIEQRRLRRIEQLERWRAEAIAVPLIGWARGINVDGRVSENGGIKEDVYSDGHTYERKGGWIPPDRYVIEGCHEDVVDGDMVWMRSAYAGDGIRYHVVADSLGWVDDATILAWRERTE